MRTDRIERDRKEPGAKGATGLIAIVRSSDLYKNLLKEVVTDALGQSSATEKSVDGVLVETHDQFESRRITLVELMVDLERGLGDGQPSHYRPRARPGGACRGVRRLAPARACLSTYQDERVSLRFHFQQ